MIAVVDTSALLRLYIPDGPVPELLESVVSKTEQGLDSILAPELIIAEAGQVLHKKTIQGIVSSEECEELMASVLSLPLKLVEHRPLIQRAMELARQYTLTVYDTLFLALAEQKGAQLITADKKLKSAAGKMSL